MTIRKLSLCVVAVVIAWTSTAQAQSHYQPYPLGLRTAGMGGAAAAFGRDSAMSWWNPAGIGRNTGTSVALTANALLASSFEIESFYAFSDDFIAASGVSPDTARSNLGGSGLQVFPSSFSYVIPLDEGAHHFIALSLVSPINTTSVHHFDVLFDPDPAINLLYIGERAVRTYFYDAGPSYALRLSDYLTIGTSVFFRYTSHSVTDKSEIAGYDINAADVQFAPSEIRDRATAYSLDLVAGTQIGPFFGFSLGLAAHAPAINLAGSYERDARIYSGSSDPLSVSVFDVHVDADTYNNKTPAWFTLGVGYELPGRFAVAVDASYYLPLARYAFLDATFENTRIQNGELAQFEEVQSTFEEERDSVLNFNVGAEVNLNPRIIVRGGFFTDFTNVPELPPLSERTIQDLDLRRTTNLGVTLGLAYAGRNTQFQISLLYRLTSGTAIGAEFPTQTYPDRDLTGNAFMIAFSGQVDSGTIASAVERAVFEEIDEARSYSTPEPSKP